MQNQNETTDLLLAEILLSPSNTIQPHRFELSSAAVCRSGCSGVCQGG